MPSPLALSIIHLKQPYNEEVDICDEFHESAPIPLELDRRTWPKGARKSIKREARAEETDRNVLFSNEASNNERLMTLATGVACVCNVGILAVPKNPS